MVRATSSTLIREASSRSAGEGRNGSLRRCHTTRPLPNIADAFCILGRAFRSSLNALINSTRLAGDPCAHCAQHSIRGNGPCIKNILTTQPPDDPAQQHASKRACNLEFSSWIGIVNRIVSDVAIEIYIALVVSNWIPLSKPSAGRIVISGAAVPRLMVTNSRKTLRCPITSLVGSPWYLRS